MLVETVQTMSPAALGADNLRGDGGSDLTVIAESSQPSVANIGINDSRENVTTPRRQSTLRSNMDGTGPKVAEERDQGQPKTVSRTSTAEARTWSSKRTYPSHSLNRTTSNESDLTPKEPKRNSTMNTDTSASFEETADWDRKAILSLGKSHHVRSSRRRPADLYHLFCRWRRHSWLLSPSDHSSLDGSHWKIRIEL